MDLKKYKEALDSLPKTIVAKYFSNNKAQFDHAKSLMVDKFEEDNDKDLSTSQPYFLRYFRENFLFFCQNAPDFVGSILYKNANKKISAIASLMGAAATTHSFTPSSKKTIANAESLYQKARKKLNKIQDSSKILKREINEVLKLIEPISIAKNYKNVLQTYYVLYSELRFSLQLLYHVEDINKTFDFNMSMAENDLPLLDVLSNTNLSLEKYSNNTFITSISEDLKILYNKIEQSHQKSKEYDLPQPLKSASQISDSNIQIIMNPFPGKKSNNEITINNQHYAKVQNSPFELLYYLLWFRKNYPDESTGLEINGVIPSDHIIEITNNDDKLNRFSAAWNDKINSRMRNEKSKTVSKINSLLKNQHKIDFDAIVEDGEYYKLTSRFKPDNIELIPFQANI